MIKLTSINIPLEVIFKNNTYILLNIRQAKEYVDGKVTDNIVATVYEVVDLDSFEKFSVKIPGTKPAVSQKYIDDATEKVKVSFINAVARPYKKATGFYELSIKADNINILTD